MTRDGLHRILLICGAFLLTLLILEIAVRMGGETDADGQFIFLSYTLPPYALPLNKLRPQVEHYLNNRNRTIFVPDPETGWTYRPNGTFYDGLFTINGSSLRSLREHACSQLMILCELLCLEIHSLLGMKSKTMKFGATISKYYLIKPALMPKC